MDADVPAHELAVLFPAPRSVQIAGRTVEIKRCGIAQAGRIIDAGSGLYALMQEPDGPEFLDLFELYPQQTTALIVAATGLGADWVSGLDPVDQFALASEWMEVNAAFFVQRLLPSLAKYMGAMGAMRGAGLPSSNTSSAMATPTPGNTPSKPPPSGSNPSQAASAASA